MPPIGTQDRMPTGPGTGEAEEGSPSCSPPVHTPHPLEIHLGSPSPHEWLGPLSPQSPLDGSPWTQCQGPHPHP